MRAKGLLAFAYAAERGFVDSMAKKYGKDIIESLLRYEGTIDDFVDPEL